MASPTDFPQAMPRSGAARNPLSLPRLRGFLALARHLNFRRAAEALGITQPGLSTQIKMMERALGVPLFARTTRRVQLTPDGERFVLHARHLIEEIETTVHRIGEASLAERGTVAFSCIPTIAATVFPRFIHEFKRRHPGVRVEMTDDTTVAMERRIVGGDVEFGIGGVPMRANDLDFAPIVEDPFVLVCRPDHPLARRRRLSIAEALQHPIITLAKDSNVRGTLVEYCRQAGLEFAPAYEVVHHYTVGAMVEAGLGVTLLPSMACVLLQKSQELCVRPLEGNEPARRVGLITRRGESLRPAARHFYLLAEKMIVNTPAQWHRVLPGSRNSSPSAARVRGPTGRRLKRR